MTLSREDQNTFLMIAIILIISIIALIAVASGIWALIKEPVNSIITSLRETIQLNQVYDYNFEIPDEALAQNQNNVQQDLNNQTSNANKKNNQGDTDTIASELEVNYNFQIPEKKNTTNQTNTQNSKPQTFKSYEAAILTTDELERIQNGEDIGMPDLRVQISKINVNSQILQGLNSDEVLKNGFWVAPISNTLGKGEVLLFCHRTYFGASDPRGCWFLDRLSTNDEIIIHFYNDTLKYRVTGVNVFNADDPSLYQLDENRDLIKIITFTPRDTGAQRLVVLAKRVG